MPGDYDTAPWQPAAGPTIFAPFPANTEYFGIFAFSSTGPDWMINFRVRDLDALAAQLRAAGIDVSIDPQDYPNGRFARLQDLEGHPIELWQPRDPRPFGDEPLVL